MQATEDSQLAFPGELVRDKEQVGRIVEADDDAEIGFPQRPDGSFEAIVLRLRPGQTVMRNRSSDALLMSDDDRERIFYVLSGTSG